MTASVAVGDVVQDAALELITWSVSSLDRDGALLSLVYGMLSAWAMTVLSVGKPP